MEFKITKEQIDELAKTGNHYTERYLQSIFPEAFKKELNGWYKVDPSIQKNYFLGYFEAGKCLYGLNAMANWCGIMTLTRIESEFQSASNEEVSASLTAEAKKRGYKKGVTCVFGPVKSKRTISTNEIKWNPDWTDKGGLCMGTDIIFTDGRWAEIVPTEKTVITREKALKILAKKLKVSPDNIEIE